MPKAKIGNEEIKQIQEARKKGDSLKEIAHAFSRSKATISKYIKGTEFSSEAAILWENKRFPSKFKSSIEWAKAKNRARSLVSTTTTRDRIFLLCGLYWGEGNKGELALINGDPKLIKTYLDCLFDIGVNKNDIRVSVRIFEDMNVSDTIQFWSEILGISTESFYKTEIIKGKKLGKLKYGMCRVRVSKSQAYFKLIMSMIDLIKEDQNAAVVQRIERETPKL